MVKKKILLITTILLILIPFLNAKAQDTITINTTDSSLDDTYVWQTLPNNSYGSLPYMIVQEHTTSASRIYIKQNISHIPSNVTILHAEYCAEMVTDGTTTNISIYQLHVNDWNESTITWNNQPCGTDFDNSTACNLTIQDTITSTGYIWHCWDITKCVNNSYINEEEEHSWAIKTNESTNTTGDGYTTKEGASQPYMSITYQPILTDLEVYYNDYFAINENNLVQANYTIQETSNPLENATCYFNSTTGNATMAYNNTTYLYEIYVIPVEADTGIVEFSVNCTEQPYQAQYQIQNYIAGVFAGTPYNLTVHLWENKNATTPYIDEFGWVLLHAMDYNCTIITQHEHCWRHAEYTNAQSNFTNLVEIGNMSMWWYSGYLDFDCEQCPPNLVTFNDFKWLGNFIINATTERIDLWVNVAELDFWRTFISWVFTWGLLIIGIALAFVTAIAFYYFTKNVLLAILSFVLVLLALSYLGVQIDVTSILSVLGFLV